MTRLALAFGAGLVALELTLAIVLVETSNHESELGGAFILAITAGVAFMVSGLIALWRRPDNRTGTYLAAVGYLWFLGALTESNNPWVYTAGFVLGGVALIPFAALLLAHPTGRFETRFDGLFPWIVGVVVVSFSLVTALVDPTLDPRCEDCPENPLALTDLPRAVSALDAVDTVAGIVLSVIAVVLLVRRWRRASRGLRRALWPVLIAGGAALAALVVDGLLSELVSTGTSEAFSPVFLVCFAAVPIAFLLGILRIRLARSSVSELVVALEAESHFATRSQEQSVTPSSTSCTGSIRGTVSEVPGSIHRERASRSLRPTRGTRSSMSSGTVSGSRRSCTTRASTPSPSSSRR